MNQTVLRLLLKHARPKILKQFRPDSCIASTRVAIDVLAHFGIAATPQPVRLYAYNWRLWRRVEAGTYRKGVLEPLDWSVGVGAEGAPPPPSGGGFLGHLVAIIPEGAGEWLIDLSLDQASRPKKEILLAPNAFLMPKEWRTQSFVIRGGPAAAVLHYTPIENERYLSSPDWTDSRGCLASITRNVVALIAKKL